MSYLKPCPCGDTPDILYISDAGQGGKWATASGDCCGSWEFEFRTSYNPLDSDVCMADAIRVWNDLPRGWID